MKRQTLKRLEGALTSYLDGLFEGIGRSERREALRFYVAGLLLDGDRKSMVPMASRLVDDEGEIQAMRQRLQECVAVSVWSESELWNRLANHLEQKLPDIEAFVIDDTGFPKKGKHSVGVQRQYSGTLGRIDNCQVAVSTHLAGQRGSACIGMNLYLPDSWAGDSARRKKAGVPTEVEFREKWKIALEQLDRALNAGVRQHVVLADAGYGDNTQFREELSARGLHWLLSISPTIVVWPPEAKLRMPPASKTGRPPTRLRDEQNPPGSVENVSRGLRYDKVRWREGSKDWQSGHFAAVRLHTAHRHFCRSAAWPMRLVTRTEAQQGRRAMEVLAFLVA